MSRSTLGLLLNGPPPIALREFLVALSAWCRPVAAEPCEPLDAWLVVGDLPGVGELKGRPVVVWRTSPNQAEVAELTVARGGGAANESSPVIVPGGLDLGRIPPLTPFLRFRWRERFLLPHPLVVDLTDNVVPDRLEATALAVASAVIAEGRDVLRALAWGAPTVTDPVTADRFGLVDGAHVSIAAGPERMRSAARLAADEVSAAALSRAGRRLVESNFNVAPAAREIARRLGFLSQESLVERRLIELGTSYSSRIAQRVSLATSGLA